VRRLRDAAAGGDAAQATHEARKDLKKVRSLLRLVRSGLDRDAYRAENDRPRSIARSLAGRRDADVLVQTAAAFGERHGGRLPATVFESVRERLAAHAAQQRDGVEERALAALAAAAQRTAAWPVEACDADVLARGAVRAYRRGRRAMNRAERDPTNENLHEWRKRVKDLWYHARLLRDAWPPVVKASADEAHALSDLLGDDHDLAVLAAQFAGDGAASHVPLDEGLVADLIARDRVHLQQRARVLGRRLYAERPKAFARRLRAYLDAAASRDGAPDGAA
jgi:CHAD domain-containing protein